MKFSIAIAAIALASSSLAVTQKCKAAGLTPYCCDSVIGGGSTLGFSIGVGCTVEAFGNKSKCPPNEEKQCCEPSATSFGPIILCQTSL